MKLRKHAASLFAVALAIGGVAALTLDRGRITDTERQDRAHDVFPAYRRGDIDAIELTQGARTLEIERRADPGDAGETHWQLTSPVDERADPAAVDRFLGDLEFAGAIRKVDPTAAPEVAKGFDPPRVKGTLSMRALTYHFALGGPAPVPEGAAYFRVEGEGTFVVSKDFVTSIMNGADAYRERNVVPYLSLDLASLEVATPSGGFTVTRADDIAFKLGSGFRASRDGLDKVWGALAEARAETFLTEEEAATALGPAPIRVLMTPKDATKPLGELLLGGSCPGHPDDVVLTRVTPVRESACVPKGALEGLRTPASALVDPRLFVARSDEVEEIVLETVPPGFALELARKGRGWHERRPIDRELEGTEIDLANDLVAKLTRGDATAVDAASPEPPFPARARVRVRRGGTSVEEAVELGPTSELVRRAFDGATLHVPATLGRHLVPSEIALRGRAVFADAGKPEALSSQCDGVRQSLVRNGDSWTMQEPRGFAADALATADLVGLVRNAQAESWVADQDDGTFGLGQSNCQMQLDTRGEAGKRVLGIVFGKEAEGGAYYARTLEGHAVFLAPHALRDGARNWLIDRGGFHANAASVEQVVVSRGASRAVFAGRRSSPREDARASDATSKVLAALDVLRPEAVLHLGPPKPEEGFGTPSLDVRVKSATDAGLREIHFVLGDATRVNGERLVYARVDGVDATYGIARDRMVALVDAL